VVGTECVFVFTYMSPNKDCQLINVTSMALPRSAFFPHQARVFASVSANSSIGLKSVGPYQVFERNVKRMQKDRTAITDGGKRSRTVDYVRDEVAERLLERFLVRIYEPLPLARGK
jgi:hypothetical protein